MTSDIQRRPAAVVVSPVSLWSRIYGLGSVFGKTMRDSRRATFVVGGVIGLLLIGVSKAIVTEFNTIESRTSLEALIQAVPPILQGLGGKVVNVGSLGGYLSYKYGAFFPIIIGLWSILALSGTLAGEARRGSLEFVAATSGSRRRIALEKLAGHLASVTIASLLIFVSLLIVGTFATLPGDEIPLEAAVGFTVWLALMGVVAGGVAFAASQFVGRGSGVGIASAVMFAGFIVNGYEAPVPELKPLANLTWFGWTSNHIPLAGVFDWPSVAIVAVAAIVLFVIGVEAYARRDIGAVSAIPTPSLPGPLVGTRGPIGRTIGHNLPAALAWGLGLGLFGLVIAGSGRSFIDQLNKSPEFVNLLHQAFPGTDIASVGGFLQLLFIEFGFILAGLAAATLVGGWASDETSGRLEMLLATPLARVRWVVGGAIGMVVALVVFEVVAGGGIAIGAAIVGGDLVTPLVGSLALGLFALALVGVGVAVAGVFGSGFAAPTVALVAVVTWFINIIAPALKLPDAVHQLALTAHYGLPMLGQWDAAGIVASLVIAVGGVAVGAWGFARRDLNA
jgi:polyether ionophore transport system permease protein